MNSVYNNYKKGIFSLNYLNFYIFLVDLFFFMNKQSRQI